MGLLGCEFCCRLRLGGSCLWKCTDAIPPPIFFRTGIAAAVDAMEIVNAVEPGRDEDFVAGVDLDAKRHGYWCKLKRRFWV